MIEKTRYSIIATALMLSFFLSSIAFAADTYKFEHIEEEGDGAAELYNGQIGEKQLSFEVSYESDDLVTFTFYNSGPEASSITDIYFDDDVPLLVFASTEGNGDGFEYSDNENVAFSEGASPGDLPAPTDLAFSSNYEYDSDPAAQPNGVNPGEWVRLYFTLSTGYSFQDLLDALGDGSFRVGIHVQGFADGGSEAFVNGSGSGGGSGGGSEVPEPATLLLLGVGMLGAAGISRKKISKNIFPKKGFLKN